MSIEATLGGIAIAIAKEAIEYGRDKLRDKAREAGIFIDENMAAAMLDAELSCLVASTRTLSRSIADDLELLDRSEAAFRNSSNVTVVDDMNETEPEDLLK